MTVITRTSNSIIENAYKLIGIFSEDRALEGGRVTEALSLLNQLLDQYASVNTRIAYDSLLNFTLTAGKQDYTFSKAIGADVDSQKIVRIKFINLTDGDFSYPVRIQPDEFFFNKTRNLISTTRPTDAYFQNQIEGSKLVFFTKPDKNYGCTIKAKFVIQSVDLNEVLNEVPSYYHMFLEYALARVLQNHYPGSIWDQIKEDFYQKMLIDISDASDVDLDARTGVALKDFGSGVSLEDFLSGC